MSADLPPKVRDRAAQAAVSEFHEYRKQYGGPNWERIADAVVAVVAPQIARPLQAENERLKVERDAFKAASATWAQRYQDLNDTRLAELRTPDA